MVRANKKEKQKNTKKHASILSMHPFRWPTSYRNYSANRFGWQFFFLDNSLTTISPPLPTLWSFHSRGTEYIEGCSMGTGSRAAVFALLLFLAACVSDALLKVRPSLPTPWTVIKTDTLDEEEADGDNAEESDDLVDVELGDNDECNHVGELSRDIVASCKVKLLESTDVDKTVDMDTSMDPDVDVGNIEDEESNKDETSLTASPDKVSVLQDDEDNGDEDSNDYDDGSAVIVPSDEDTSESLSFENIQAEPSLLIDDDSIQNSDNSLGDQMASTPPEVLQGGNHPFGPQLFGVFFVSNSRTKPPSRRI